MSDPLDERIKKISADAADRVYYGLLMVEIDAIRTEQETLRSMYAANAASIQALKDMLTTVAEKAGFDGVRFLEALDKLEKEKHQSLLEFLENASPALAARHDKRKQSDL